MSATSQTREIDRYELAVDQAIAICGGDVRGALKVCILANEYLEAELQAVYAAVSSGYARGRIPKTHVEKSAGVCDG